MTASGAGETVGMRRPAARADALEDPTRPEGVAAEIRRTEVGPEGSAEPVAADGGAWSPIIKWLAGRLIPRLAPTALISVFPPATTDSGGTRPRPTYHLIRSEAESALAPATGHIICLALDAYAPVTQIVEGSGQLWQLDSSLLPLLAPGTSAIAAPLTAGRLGLAAVTLFRPPNTVPFSLDDLLTLQTLVTQIPGSGEDGDETTAKNVQSRPPGTLTPSAPVQGLRDLMRDLADGDTPYDVARRLVRSAQTFFAAQSCVVYFVAPAQMAPADRSPPDRPSTGQHPRLRLAASVGSGVLLTPPWLEPVETAGPETLFASGPDSAVLMAHLGDEAPWVQRTVTDDVLVALPLRSDGKLLAILGMRGPRNLAEMAPVTAEDFALIGANALLVARQRDADQSSILTLRSELARNRLAHNATIAMFGATDVISGLHAHANLLVPGIADGYLVYLSGTSGTGGVTDPSNGSGLRSGRIFSHWRGHEDTSARTRFEEWVDSRLSPLLFDDRPAEELPLLLSDVHLSPGLDRHLATQTTPPAAIHSLAAVPLIRNGATFGALVLVTTEHLRRYGQRDFALIGSLAEPVARLFSTNAVSPNVPNDSFPDETNASDPSTDLALLAGLASRFIRPLEIDEIAQLSAQALADHLTDWCVVELSGAGAPATLTFGANADPAQEWPHELWAGLIQNRDASRGPAKVLRNGQSDLSVTVDWLAPTPGEENDALALCPERIPASSISAPIVSGLGEVIGVISCFRTRPAIPFVLGDLATLELTAEITGDAITAARQRQSEREVGAQQRWLGEQRTQLMAQLADAVIVLDQSQRIIFWNIAARLLHGGVDLPATVDDYLMTYQPRETNGNLFTRRTFPLVVALSTETKQHGVWRLRITDDLSIAVVAAVNPIRAEDGSISGAVLSLHDVTENYEQESGRQRQLVEISDELRSPIASIKGWSQYLTQRNQTPGETTLDSRAVDAIAKQTRRLQQLVERLIAASQSELTEDFAAQPRRLDLHELLGQLVHTFRGLSPSRSITLTVPNDGEVGGRWESDDIARIFGDLIANAISSSPDGSPIEITTERKSGRIAVSVTDHGPEIAPDRLQTIFEKRETFQDIRAAESMASGATVGDIPATEIPSPGFDLRTIERLVRRLHGQISLRSTVGTGNTFTVQLPLDP